MPTILHLKPIVPTVEAWQFRGQPQTEWPTWVIGKSVNFGSELLHDRKSGRQIVYWGEWLVKVSEEADGVWWFSDEEMHASFGEAG